MFERRFNMRIAQIAVIVPVLVLGAGSLSFTWADEGKKEIQMREQGEGGNPGDFRPSSATGCPTGPCTAQGNAPRTPPATLRGEVVKIIDDENSYLPKESWVVKDEKGKEVRIEVDQETRMPSNFKIGDRIVAKVEPQGHAWSIRKHDTSGMGSVIRFGDARVGPPAQSDLPGH
jgi:hypothetical protein